MMNNTNLTGSQLASKSPAGLVDGRIQLAPNLPIRDLITGPREEYLRIAVPLYNASVRCDWKAAKDILDKDPRLVRYSITEYGETALHIAATMKRSKHVEKFVENLLGMMKKEDMELQNENFNTALYLAAAAGNIKTATIIVENNKDLTRIPGAGGIMMPLYVAALFGHHEVVKYLYENSNELCDDGWNSENRGWLLQKCVEGDMFDVALKIVKKYPKTNDGTILGVLAGKPDAFSERKSHTIKQSINSVFSLIGLKVEAYEKESEALQLLKIVWGYVAKMPKREIDAKLRGPPDLVNLSQALPIQKLIYDHLGELEVETENIMGGPPNMIKFDKHLKLHKLISEHSKNIHTEVKNIIRQETVSRKEQTLKIQKLVFEEITNIGDKFENLSVQASGNEDQASGMEDQASYLQQHIIQHIKKMRDLVGLNRKHYSSRVMFIAAKMGNTMFLVELIRRYPDLIWKVDDNRQSIFHIAVKNRHEGTYNLLYEIGSMKDLITPIRDEDENNMLHFVGKMPTKERLADVSGPALQMQRELLWFKEVRNMIPPSYRERKNKDGLTPRELFTEEHKELIREGEKWMKETASQCMVVAALIATIVFAAAFTVPGGYNQTDGIPIFHKRAIFIVFVVADAMSLFLSSTSILIFLSILTSRYAERDFVESLPTKLMLGISTLFLSITAMMITFSVSFFILYHKEMKWIPILLSVFALMPVLLYVLLQYHVLADVIRSTYGSKYLFKPGKQVLYYENPRI